MTIKNHVSDLHETKIKKTYRLTFETILEIDELKEDYAQQGIRMTATDIIEKAIYNLYITEPERR